MPSKNNYNFAKRRNSPVLRLLSVSPMCDTDTDNEIKVNKVTPKDSIFESTRFNIEAMRSHIISILRDYYGIDLNNIEGLKRLFAY